MFKVKDNETGRIFTVYAASGTMFLVWNDCPGEDHWEWMYMNRFKPVEEG